MGLKYFSVKSRVELRPIFQENIPTLLKKYHWMQTSGKNFLTTFGLISFSNPSTFFNPCSFTHSKTEIKPWNKAENFCGKLTIKIKYTQRNNIFYFLIKLKKKKERRRRNEPRPFWVVKPCPPSNFLHFLLPVFSSSKIKCPCPLVKTQAKSLGDWWRAWSCKYKLTAAAHTNEAP